MKSLKTFLVLAILLALSITLSATPSEEGFHDEDDETTGETSDLPLDETRESTSLRGTNRFLTQKYGAFMTCDKYPKICRAKGSRRRNCCNKRCVNLKTDGLNCGKCGKKCSYSKICCEGKCVNPRTNKKHCGSCGNRCKKGSSCAYGMCSYA